MLFCNWLSPAQHAQDFNGRLVLESRNKMNIIQYLSAQADTMCPHMEFIYSIVYEKLVYKTKLLHGV